MKLGEGSERQNVDLEARRKFLRTSGVTLASAAVGAGGVGLAITGVKRFSKQDSAHDNKEKRAERIKSKAEEALDVQLNFLNELNASDDIAILAVCKGGSEGFEQLMRERIGLPSSSSRITDSDPKSLAGRKLIGWFNRSEGQNKELGKVFDVNSLRTAIGLHIHDIKRELVRAKKESLKEISKKLQQ